MSAGTRLIRIEIGVPDDGTPSVFSTKIEHRDSKGKLWRSMTKGERALALRALLNFLPYLVE
jgi:hypothetical protein